MKTIFCLCIVVLIFITCENSNSIDFSELNGNIYTLKIDRVLNKTEAKFHDFSLQESDYISINPSTKYEIMFSEDGKKVTIAPGAIIGELSSNGEKVRLYELVEGLFAGGHLRIWINDNCFEAEYTMYGSGVPVVYSERGILILEKE